MVLLPIQRRRDGESQGLVAQQLQTTHTTNQSTGSRAARLSEIEKLAVDVADLEKQVAQARKRADYARRARAGTRTRQKRPRAYHDAPPPPPRRRKADDDEDDAFDEMQSGLDSSREKRDMGAAAGTQGRS